MVECLSIMYEVMSLMCCTEKNVKFILKLFSIQTQVFVIIPKTIVLKDGASEQ